MTVRWRRLRGDAASGAGPLTGAGAAGGCGYLHSGDPVFAENFRSLASASDIKAICEAFGGTVTYTKQLMHGKQKQIRQTTENRIFTESAGNILAARYHSLAAKKETLPPELVVTAESEDGSHGG